MDSTRISALSEADRAALRLRKFGFVFQFGQLLPDLTALDNITIPLLLAGRKRTEAIRQSSERTLYSFAVDGKQLPTFAAVSSLRVRLAATLLLEGA